MTNEEAIEILKDFEELNSCVPEDKEAVNTAIKALEERSTLDKIRDEIQGLRNCSCSCSDGIIDDVEDIIDKYKAESEG